MLHRRDILRLIFMVLPFIVGMIAGIVMLASSDNSDLYAGLCIFGGIVPTGIYCTVVKIKEHRGLKKIDTTGFEVKTATVKYCEVSSYKSTSKHGPTVPDVYVITATSGNDVYKVYSKRSYACGAEIELYVGEGGKKVRIKQHDSDSSEGKYLEMRQAEDAFFDRICDTCDDDTYDTVYIAWETEADNVGDDLTSYEVLCDRIELVQKYNALLDAYKDNKQADGLIHITEQQMKEFFESRNAAAELETNEQEPEQATETPIVSEPENIEENVAEQNAQGLNATDAEPEKPVEPETMPQRSAAVGYKGIKKIKNSE